MLDWLAANALYVSLTVTAAILLVGGLYLAGAWPSALSTSINPDTARIVTGAKRAPKTIRGKVLEAVRYYFGSEKDFGIRVGILAIVATAAVVVGGLVLLAANGSNATAETAPFLRTVITLIRDFHVWAAIAALVALFAFAMMYQRMAYVTARHSRFDHQLIVRLAREVRSSTGGDVIFGNAGDEQDALHYRLLQSIDAQLSDGLDITESRTGLDEVPDKETLPERTVADGPADVVDSDGDKDTPSTAPPPQDEAREDGPAGSSRWGSQADDTTPPEDVSVRDRFDEWRATVWSTFSVGDFLLRFVAPALLTIFVELLLLQRAGWELWVYAIVVLGGLLVGSITYTVSKWFRHRRLSKSRDHRRTPGKETIPTVVKTIETPGGDPNGYVIWMGGHRYFDYDPFRLAEKVALAWYCRMQPGHDVPPLIQEKYARDVARMDPIIEPVRIDDFEGKAAMLSDLVEVVIQATDPGDMVPKHELLRRASQLGYGIGHDPVLLGEVYAENHPEVFAEKTVEVTDAHGKPHEVVMVHLRTVNVEPTVAQLRTDHSNSIIPPSNPNPAYEAPEVSLPSAREYWSTRQPGAGRSPTGTVGD
jgi:hypothetical protein